MGTRVAIDLARRLPDRIERLLLLGPVGLSEPPVEQPGPPLLEALSLWLLGLHWVRRWLRRFMHANPKQTCTAGELEICSVHLATPGWRQSLRSFGRSGGFGSCQLPLPSLPILAILGKDDQLVRSRQRQLVGNLLGPNLIALDACGHLPQWEHPEQVASIWYDWLSDDSGA